MHSLKTEFNTLLTIVRAYSLPISVMSWFCAFLYSLLRGGSFKHGFFALIGIIFLHLATNLFDDIIDYIREKNKINRGLKQGFNFQKNKCFHLLNGNYTLKQYIIILTILMIPPILFAIYFIRSAGNEIFYIIIPTVVICALYPVLGCLGLGEILVATVFSPLLYLGVNYVMSGNFSFDILIISISTGLLAVAVLHNHMLLDFRVDEENRKITLCRLCKTKQNALHLLVFFISGAYFNILFWTLKGVLNYSYLTVFLSFPTAVTLYNVMKIHINNPESQIKYNIFMGDVREADKLPADQRGFLLKFLIVRNLLNYFTLYLCISMVAECILSKN